MLFPQKIIQLSHLGLLGKYQILSELIQCGICTFEESVSDTLQFIWKTEYIKVKFLSKSLSVRVLKAWFYPDNYDLTFSDFINGFYQSFEKKFESSRLPVN